MAAIALILAILLVNRVLPQTTETLNSVNAVNTLAANSTESIFALQIRRFRTTTEATPAAAAGNNLNVVGSTLPTYTAERDNYQAISTSYSETLPDKKYEFEDEVNSTLYPFQGNMTENKKKSSEQFEDNQNVKKPLALIWDSCLETNFKDSPINTIKAPSDKDNTNNDFQIHQSNAEIGNIWNKRDAGNINNSLAMKAWLDKYDSLRNSKTDERKQQKQDSILMKKISQPTTTTEVISTVQIIPITKEVFIKPVDIFNATQSTVATESNIFASYTEDWFEVKDRSKIRFGGLPQKETYLIPALKLEEGFYPFTFMSDFFTLIYPFDFPVGKFFLS